MKTMQITISDTTADRLEAVSGEKIARGGDRLINNVLNIAEGIAPDETGARVIACSGMQEALADEEKQ